MKVISLDNSAVETHCQLLSNLIIESKFIPELILGVETGGREIATNIYNNIKLQNIRLEYCIPVKKKHKKKNPKLLKILPVFILDFLRIIQAKFFFNKRNRGKFSEIKLPDDIQNFKSILIVDDAIDSGKTLSAITAILKKLLPTTVIKTAVLTVTKANPAVLPDYFIYNDKTLIRFPWSKDAK